ncbi:alcohol dehydrogenase [Colletotrichum incanum]|uniref:Alcohol dehydrogenase n=1 Tax=Colletotrichum incanum TaxID=1573173 RepID=A0A167AY85_COLIC|nr:alcohol dehydrogenase [Colletotrichum incanum]OHW99113.1 alcohol dehydrogenase [Colletotrichum incanum]
MSATPKSSVPALYIDEDCKLQVIYDVPVPKLVDGEAVIKVLYSGVNPADVKHGQVLGVRPTTIGYDFCGRVVQAAATSHLKAGELVAGYTPTGIGRPLKYGVHQEYLSCPEDMMFKVPENLPQTHAASLTTVLTTAADGLYNIFGFPLPGEKPKYDSRPGPLLIWGASASVGVCMLQLARASGASPILVTASPKRHELLKKLGATQCFDYGSPDVVSRIKAAVEESKAGPIAYAADCAGSVGDVSSVAQMEACVGDDALILSVVVHPGKRYKLPLASAVAPVKFQLRDGAILTFPARPEDWTRMWKALMWAVEKYGAEFELPVVDVFKGSAEEALEKIKNVAEQGKFGKLVLEQPLS